MTPLLLQGTAQRLPLADNSINTIITSPPYYGLRAYDALSPEAWPGGAFVAVPGAVPIDIPAWEGCLGSEPTVDLYLWHMVVVLREMHRLLRDDGTCYINLGDSYAHTSGGGAQGTTGQRATRTFTAQGCGSPQSAIPSGNLLGIPWRVALAAQAEGWILRRDVVWQKVSPMPESLSGVRWERKRCACLLPNRVYSGRQKAQENGHREHPSGGYTEAFPATVADPLCADCHGTGRQEALELRRGSWRHTASHEYIFMLVKRMGYYANSEAVREENQDRAFASRVTHSKFEWAKHAQGNGGSKPNLWMNEVVSGRNPRDVLRPAPSPLHLAHYAAFPPSLPEQFLRASCPERVCVQCGEPWAIIVQHSPSYPSGSYHDHAGDGVLYGKRQNGVGGLSGAQLATLGDHTTHGLAPTCRCYCACIDPITEAISGGGPLDITRTCCGKLPSFRWTPGIALDCFAGTATVALVARALARASVMVEASPAYLQLARERLSLDALDAWEGKPVEPKTETYTDLPLFG